MFLDKVIKKKIVNKVIIFEFKVNTFSFSYKKKVIIYNKRLFFLKKTYVCSFILVIKEKFPFFNKKKCFLFSFYSYDIFFNPLFMGFMR